MAVLSNFAACFGPTVVSVRWKNLASLWMVILWLLAPVGLLLGQTANGTSGSPPAPLVSDDHETFGHYLVEHRDDLAPFFNAKGNELFRQTAPLILGLLGKIMTFTLLTCWVFDVAIIRWFSRRYAPALAKFKRALMYATGRLVLSVLFYAIFGLSIVFVSGLGHEAIIVVLLFFVFLLIELVVQTGWIHYLYSTPVANSFLCYLGIFVVHVVTGFLVSAPILTGHATALATIYVDGNVTPKMEAVANAEKKDLAAAVTARDALQAQIDDARKKLVDNAGEQTQLQQEIDQAKNSDTYLFSKIVKLHAQGDLATARGQLADLMNKFPTSPIMDTMKQQLAGIDSDIATQIAQQKQAEAAAAQAAAQARADLVARAAQGEVTLSEMRLALVGKTPAEVASLFGPPTVTASNRWGYSKRMTVNPLSQEKFGLAVYFANGTVQGVDYYYDTGPARGTETGGGETQ